MLHDYINLPLFNISRLHQRGQSTKSEAWSSATKLFTPTLRQKIWILPKTQNFVFSCNFLQKKIVVREVMKIANFFSTQRSLYTPALIKYFYFFHLLYLEDIHTLTDHFLSCVKCCLTATWKPVIKNDISVPLNCSTPFFRIYG